MKTKGGVSGDYSERDTSNDSERNNYYENRFYDAMEGDDDAIAEMREEFGDNWEEKI